MRIDLLITSKIVNLKSLNLDSTFRELAHKKNIKKWQFLASKFINSPINQKAFGVQSGNWDTMWVLMNALCKPSLGAPSYETKISQAENGQKVNDFEPTKLGKYRFVGK